MQLRGLLHRLRVLLAPRSYDREVEAEIQFHLELEAMHARGIGLSELDAECTARRRFGNITQVREEVRRMRGTQLIDRVRQDLVYAVRGLVRAPGFTVAVVLTLGLGLGVNAAMFTFLNRVFLEPPAAVARPAEVRRIYSDGIARGETGRQAYTAFKYPQIREISRAVGPSLQLGIFTDDKDSVALSIGGGVIPARRTLANTAFFRTLGIQSALGRWFDAEEDRVETPAAVAVISHALWKRAFNGDSSVLGTVFRIRQRPVTVIGVASEAFSGIELDRSDFWMPIGNYNTDPPTTPAWYDTFHSTFALVARFTDPSSEQRFIAAATRAHQSVRMARYYFDTLGTIRTGPIQAAMGPARRAQEVSISLRLGGVVLIVLLIAIANVSNLLLVRATRRAREIAVRRALGVSRSRLFEQFLVESLVLASLGGGVAILLAIWVGAALRRLLMPEIKWATGVMDLRTMASAIAMTLLVGVVVGLAPAMHAWRPDVVVSLKAGSNSGAYRRSRLRSALLIAQAALSVVLLVGAGLFVRSLRNVQNIDLGYDAERTLSASAIAEERDIKADVLAAMPAVVSRIAAIPGVEAVATASFRPMGGFASTRLFLPGRDSIPKTGGSRSASFINVSPGFFRATGIRLIAGRDFARPDEPALIVSELMARAWWPGESAVGKCVSRRTRETPCMPVIGVVESTHQMGVIEKEQIAQYYVSEPGERRVLIVRAEPSRQAAVASLIVTEVKLLIPQADRIFVRSLSRTLEPEFRPWKLGATLFTAMGILALVVAAIGVYSVMAYAVSQRTHEMGIRIALGARMADIMRLVIGDGLRTVSIGIGLGVALAFGMGRLVASILYGISPRDPWVLGVAAASLALIGLIASFIPAARASSVDPMTALRAD